MALRYSKGLRNFLLEGGSLKRAFAGGSILIYTGSQPAAADGAVSGTLLVTITKSSGALTKEVLATGSVTIAGASGSIDTIKLAIGGGTAFDILGGSVAFDTDINTTATKVATQINNNPANIYVTASTTGASGVITFTTKPGMGATANGWVPSGTGTTLTVGTAVNIGSGVAGVSHANGLTWGDASAGALVKNPLETWSGVAAATGTAGWFRILGSVNDPGTADSSELYIRLDGSVATSGADLNLSSTAITSGATETLSAASFTLPAQ